MTPVFDSNILIDYLNGITEARTEILLYPRPLISVITWMEVLIGARTDPMRQQAEKLLGCFEMVDVTQALGNHAIAIRQEHRIALPDAIIWATARVRETLLITRNEKDFPAGQPDIRIPYRL